MKTVKFLKAFILVVYFSLYYANVASAQNVNEVQEFHVEKDANLSKIDSLRRFHADSMQLRISLLTAGFQNAEAVKFNFYDTNKNKLGYKQVFLKKETNQFGKTNFYCQYSIGEPWKKLEFFHDLNFILLKSMVNSIKTIEALTIQGNNESSKPVIYEFK